MDDEEYFASLPWKRMSAAMLFTDPAGQVLVVEPTYRPDWLIPGGVVEFGESPRMAAIREVEEELGFHVEPGPLLVMDWASGQGERGESLTFIFAGGPVDDALVRLPAEELRSWAWCSLPVAQQRLSGPLHRRVVASFEAIRLGATLYLEDGLKIG